MYYVLAFCLGFALCAYLGRERPKKEEPAPEPRYLLEARVYDADGVKVEHCYKADFPAPEHGFITSCMINDMQTRWADRRVEYIWSH